MPCYSPLQGWRSRERNASGKRGITFDFRSGYADQPLEVPCGQCIGCKIVRSRQWALRCQHEASLYDANCFLTLTYERSPPELVKPDLQDFFKRMRERLRNRGLSFRYFGVGEYGAKFQRPHYHALIFGYDFEDKEKWGGSPRHPIFRSQLLEELWPMGHSSLGTVTSESAQYVSKYCTKALKGKKADEHYQGRAREFAIMSRRPGIGKGWIEKFGNSVFPRDFVVVEGGAKVAAPKYYLQNMPEKLQKKIKHARLERNADNPDARGVRAVAKAICAEERIKRATRSFEDDHRSI